MKLALIAMVIYWPLFLPVLTFETASVRHPPVTGSVEPSDMFSPESEPQGGQGDENRPHHISNSREPGHHHRLRRLPRNTP
jgi:hypothetical protein